MIRSDAPNFVSSARQPDLRISWKVSIFRRIAYQESFSRASARECTGRLVINLQSIGGLPDGALRSRAWITVSVRE